MKWGQWRKHWRNLCVAIRWVLGDVNGLVPGQVRVKRLCRLEKKNLWMNMLRLTNQA